MNFGWRQAIFGLLGAATLFIAVGLDVVAEENPAPTFQTTPSTNGLTFLPEHQDIRTRLNEADARFTFGVTNTSDAEVVIDNVQPSCSCTVAKLPRQPWHLLPHTGGKIDVSVNLEGRFGTFNRKIVVHYADPAAPATTLSMTITTPDKKLMRETNLKLATGNRQAVFHGDCARCHADPAEHVTGHELFHKICGVCHEAKPLATQVPDLYALKHPTDYAFWKMIIANGKPGTLMPAFAIDQGGPLTDDQIDDLAKDCARFIHALPPDVPGPTSKK